MFLLKKYKIALSSNDDKRMRLIDLTETYACGTSKDLISRKIINFDDITKERIK